MNKENNSCNLTFKNNFAYFIIYAGFPIVIGLSALFLIYLSVSSKQYEGAFFSLIFVIFSFKSLKNFKSHTWAFNRGSGLLEIINKNLLGKQVRYKSYDLSKIEALYYANYTETSNDNIKRIHKGLFTIYFLIEGEEINFFKPQSKERTKQTAEKISQILNIPFKNAS